MRLVFTILLAFASALSSVPEGSAAAQSPPSWEYRLAGGSSATSGRLEARSNSSAAWGTVCDNAFTWQDARVACRSLGHLTDRGVLFRTVLASEQGAQSQPIVLDGLACTSRESQLDECDRSSAETTCTHSRDVWLMCQPSRGTDTATTTWEFRLVGGNGTYGRLEARSNSSATWGTVCDDYFNAPNAQVACRSVGLPTAHATFRTVTESERGATSQPTVMDDLYCHGDEATLDRCSRGVNENCDHTEDIHVSCPSSASATPSPTPPPTPEATSWQYRLVDGGSDYGRLEARPSATSHWGTVCDDLFGSADARVACRSLGMSTATVAYRTADTAERGATSQSIWMARLACSGSESSLDRCTHASSHNCDHGEDIVLACSRSSVPRLSDSDLTTTETDDSSAKSADDGSSGISVGVVVGLIVAVVIVAAIVAVVASVLVIRGLQRSNQQQREQRPADDFELPPAHQVVVGTVAAGPGEYSPQHQPGVIDGYHAGQPQPQPTYPYTEPRKSDASQPVPNQPAAPQSYGHPLQPQTTTVSGSYSQSNNPCEAPDCAHGEFSAPEQPAAPGRTAANEPATTNVSACSDVEPQPSTAQDDRRE